MTNIKLGDFNIDLEKLMESRLLLQANSGGGKSYGIRKLAEETHRYVQQVIIDLEGEFNTLREKYDYVLVGKDGDIPISIKIAEILPRKIIESGASFILDLSELKHHERILFVKRFLTALMELPKKYWKPLMVVIDEAHIFCPEKGKAESAGSVIDLQTRGRKRGYCGCLATQRLSKLSKDAAAECNNKMIGRTGLDVDMRRASDELGFTSKEDQLSLRQLEPGEFYVFGTAISKSVERVKIGKVKTTHLKAGQRIIKQMTPPRSKVKAIIEKLLDLPQEAEKEKKTEQELRTELRTLKAKMTMMEKQKPAPSQELVDKAYANGYSTAQKDRRRVVDDLMRRIDKMRVSLKSSGEQLLKAAGQDDAEPLKWLEKAKAAPPPALILAARPAAPAPSTVELDGEFKLSAVQERILKSLSKLLQVGLVDVPRPMLAAFSKSSPKSGHFANSISNLRTNGMVDYGREGTVKITEFGLGMVGQEEAPASDKELQERWLDLMNSLQKRIFEVLLERHPQDISREEMAELTGSSPTSGHYANCISAMRTMGAVEYTEAGRIKASSNVFLGGAS